MRDVSPPRRRGFACALAAFAVACALALAPAAAAAVDATVRVEGSTATLLDERQFSTDTRTVPVGECTGGPGTREIPGATALGILDDAARAGGFSYDTSSFGPGPGELFVCRAGSDQGGATAFWIYKVNHRSPDVGGGAYALRPGDRVLWYFTDDFTARTLDLTGPAQAAVGEAITVRVAAYDTAGVGSPGAGASVTATGPSGSTTATAGADGAARLSLAGPGIHTLEAVRAGDIRSNSIDVCVPVPGRADCGPDAGTPAGAPRGGPARVRDARAPAARISTPRDRRTYRRGPRVLRGTASDDASGVGVVKLALRRHAPGGSCRWWSGRRERFVGSHCRKTYFFAIGDDTEWSYLLPRPLPRGRYVLDVKAFDRAGNRGGTRARGSARVSFRVSGTRARGRRPARSAARAMAARRTARVDVMVVGKEGVLVPATRVRAAAGRVTASGRRCAVASSTPLAALRAVLARARVGYHVRDFGRCSRRRSRDSAQLFVDRIARDRNEGQDGWVYKVNHRAGSAGGADPAGLRGGGLRSGDRVLWFYCRLDARIRGCQESLSVAAPARSLRFGATLEARVRAHGDDGRGRPLAGAAVTLGAASAQTDTLGIARLVPPAPGRHLLIAARPGAVPAFPATVVVR